MAEGAHAIPTWIVLEPSVPEITIATVPDVSTSEVFYFRLNVTYDSSDYFKSYQITVEPQPVETSSGSDSTGSSSTSGSSGDGTSSQTQTAQDSTGINLI